MDRKTGQRWIVALCAAVMVAATATVAYADHVPLLDNSLGFPYDENFNAGPAWTAQTPPPQPFAPVSSWAHGTPTSGPGVAFSGTKVWATNLAGNYSTNECGALLSPPIDLTGATSASVSFQQWRHMEESTLTTGSAFDAGMLFATTNGGSTWAVVNPGGGYTSKSIGTTSRTCLDAQPTGAKGLSGPAGTAVPPAVYSPVTADLSSFAGGTVQFAIAFASDGSIARAGWYVDDFAVTIDGVTTTQDFESGDGGFTIVSTRKPLTPLGWSHGTPTNGPAGSEGLDAPLWATNLTGSYGQKECSSIESPAFTVGVLPDPLDEVNVPTTRATLSWTQFFRSSSISAGGVVQVGENGSYTNIKPTTGYTGSPGSALDACLEDDTQGTGGFAGLVNTVGSSMTPYTADLTPWMGKQITLRFLFASTESTSTNDGWYVDDVNVEVRSTVYEPHPPAPPSDVPFTPVQTLYSQTFEDGDGGYTTSGTPTWEHGAVVSPPNPQEGQGASMWGTNIDGSYNNLECGTLQSAPIDLSGTPAAPGGEAMLARLSFKQWIDAERRFDGGVVEVSADGATWTRLTPLGGYDDTAFTTARACLGLSTTDLFFTNTSTSTTDADAWTLEEFDVSGFLGGQLHVRWRFASDSSVTRRGWYVDDVEVALGAGANLPAPPPVPSEVPIPSEVPTLGF